MKICQEFAILNRMSIAKTILCHLWNRMEVDSRNWDSFETIHNYISFEDNIVRKGAISARKGEKVLIPMNMRDGCIIGIGKGNDDWNQSAPHGAGRIMSRMQAKKTFKIEEFKNSMQEIIDCIGDTVEIIKIIKPIYNFKAGE